MHNIQCSINRFNKRQLLYELKIEHRKLIIEYLSLSKRYCHQHILNRRFELYPFQQFGNSL